MAPERLIVSRSSLHHILAHARECYPREAVGLLTGNKLGDVKCVRTLTNIGPAGTFFVDPFEQWKAFQEFRRARRELLAIYHSHPDGGVGLSDADVFFAREHDALCVVVEVGMDKRQSQFCAYRVTADVTEPVDIQVVA